MTNAELKDALMSGVEVIADHPLHGKSLYKCVRGVIYRRVDGKIKVYAELIDFCNRSTLELPGEMVKVHGKSEDI